MPQIAPALGPRPPLATLGGVRMAPAGRRPGPLGLLARLRRIAVPLGVVALGLAGLAAWFWPALPAQAAAGSAAALGLSLALALALARPTRSRAQAVAEGLRARLALDPDATVLTDLAGTVLTRTHGAADPPLDAWLEGWSAEPRRVVALALEDLGRRGRVVREFRRGSAGLRLSAHVVGGSGVVLWRLAQLERPARRGLEVFGLPILTLGADGRAVAANPALLRLIDLPEGVTWGEAGLSDLDDDLLAPALAPILTPARAALASGRTEFALRLPGGQPATGHAVSARDGQCDLVLVTGDDPALSAAGAGPQDYEDIPVALVQLDADGRISGSNRAARGLLGLVPAEDRFLWEVVEGLGRPVADWLRDARDGRALNRPEVLRATCAGAETFVQIILRRPGAPAAPGALIAVINDATELKSLEARFVQSQKMQAIGQLAGGIAHDFNNLLTAISGHCDLLLMGRDVFDPDHGDLQQIQQNANRAAALVRQLLAFSRKQTLMPEVMSVEAMLEDVVRLLNRLVGERIMLQLSHDPRLPLIRADRRQLEQVIVNLVVNARDAMPMGGTIRIETEALVLPGDRMVGRARVPAGAYSVIRVIDNGVGIPPDIRDKIFEPFFTTKRPGEGTGLGLSTAYGIVKQMGGFIFAESREGSGATFLLYFAASPATEAQAEGMALSRPLPAVGAPAPAAAGAAGASPADARGPGLRAPVPGSAPRDLAETGPDWTPRSEDRPGLRPGRVDAPPAGIGPAPTPRFPRKGEADRHRPPAPPAAGSAVGRPVGRAVAPVAAPDELVATVLLVEDEAPVRAFAARALRLHGYRVLEATDGEAALEVLAEWREKVDLVVTDVIMPGLDGPGWVARALESHPQLPVVFMSGYIEDTLTEALGRTPNAVFLEKPFSLELLCQTIAAQLGAGATAGRR